MIRGKFHGSRLSNVGVIQVSTLASRAEPTDFNLRLAEFALTEQCRRMDGERAEPELLDLQCVEPAGALMSAWPMYRTVTDQTAREFMGAVLEYLICKNAVRREQLTT